MWEISHYALYGLSSESGRVVTAPRAFLEQTVIIGRLMSEATKNLPNASWLELK